MCETLIPVRPYRHVLEALFAYLLIGQKQYENKKCAGWYNVGPEDQDCVTTEELVNLFCQAWGNGSYWESHVEANAPHEDRFLKLDCSKINAVVGWRAKWGIQRAIMETVNWAKIWQADGRVSAEMDRQIKEYIDG